MTLAIFVSVILSEIKCVEDFVRPLYIFVPELALFQAALLDLPPTAVLPLPAQERRRRHRGVLPLCAAATPPSHYGLCSGLRKGSTKITLALTRAKVFLIPKFWGEIL